MRRTATILTTALLLAIPSTAAAKPARCVVPNVKGDTLTQARHRLHVAHCSTGAIFGARNGKVTAQVPRAGRKLKHGSKVSVTLKAVPVTTPAPNVSYTAAVDPSFTQNPDNPLQVTYAVSADAIEVQNGATTNLATTGQLPDGILNFYSQGTLACTMNVGGANDGGPCTITYPATGTYTVETEYIPNGVSAVEETDQETINPFATVTDLATAVGADQGTYFDVGVAWSVQGPSGQTVPIASATVPTYTITDTTTGQTVGTWSGPAGQHSCYIVVAGTTGGIYYNGGSCWNGDSNTVSSADSYVLTVTFPGQPGDTTSTSTQQPV